MSDALSQIKETVEANDVVLFMKGTSQMPQCSKSRLNKIMARAGFFQQGTKQHK